MQSTQFNVVKGRELGQIAAYLESSQVGGGVATTIGSERLLEKGSG